MKSVFQNLAITVVACIVFLLVHVMYHVTVQASAAHTRSIGNSFAQWVTETAAPGSSAIAPNFPPVDPPRSPATTARTSKVRKSGDQRATPDNSVRAKPSPRHDSVPTTAATRSSNTSATDLGGYAGSSKTSFQMPPDVSVLTCPCSFVVRNRTGTFIHVKSIIGVTESLGFDLAPEEVKRLTYRAKPSEIAVEYWSTNGEMGHWTLSAKEPGLIRTSGVPEIRVDLTLGDGHLVLSIQNNTHRLVKGFMINRVKYDYTIPPDGKIYNMGAYHSYRDSTVDLLFSDGSGWEYKQLQPQYYDGRWSLLVKAQE